MVHCAKIQIDIVSLKVPHLREDEKYPVPGGTIWYWLL